jgi:hypothetical protein
MRIKTVYISGFLKIGSVPINLHPKSMLIVFNLINEFFYFAF